MDLTLRSLLNNTKVRKLNYKAIGGASLPKTNRQATQILKVFNLEDDGVEMTEEEIVPVHQRL